MALDDLQRRVLLALADLGFPGDFQEAARLAAQGSPRAVDVRPLLEGFCNNAVALTRQGAALQLRRPGPSIRAKCKYLMAARLLTQPEVSAAIAIYELHNDPAHGRAASLDPASAIPFVFGVMNAVLGRIAAAGSLSPESPADRPSRYIRRATEWLISLRRGDPAAMTPGEFRVGEIDALRELLTPADVSLLLQIIANDGVHPSLRNRAASIILNDNPVIASGRAEIALWLRNYYFDHLTQPLHVLRAIALALANQTNDADCLLHYISVIRDRPEELECALQTSERYYGSVSNTLDTYLDRILDTKLTTAAVAWEIFFVGHRGGAELDDSRTALDVRLRISSSPDLYGHVKNARNQLQALS